MRYYFLYITMIGILRRRRHVFMEAAKGEGVVSGNRVALGRGRLRKGNTGARKCREGASS